MKSKSKHREFRPVSLCITLNLLLAGFFFSVSTAQAQTASATLTGVVKDTTEGVIPGVNVTVTNEDTNLGRSTETDGSGNYTVPALNPGPYRVEAQLEGFQRAVLSGIILQVNQEARVDIEMQVGQVTEVVEVEATAILLQTESPEVGGVVEERRIVDLPLNGRNFMELITLTAGTNQANSSTAKGGLVNKGYAPSAAGMPATENNYQLDGADNREGFFNTFNVAPSVDAVQEFNIRVGQYSAEFGAGGGAIVNVVTKSGTNKFHGSAFEFVRNDNFDARNFFLPATAEIAPLARNQFGGSAGGPIVKNRLFIFGNVDFTRERRGLFRSGNVPTPEQMRGDLSAFGKDLKDPFTKDPIPNSIIPASQINSISANLVQLYPGPNAPNPLQNWINSPSGKDDFENYLVRSDFQVNDRNNFFGRYALQDRLQDTPGTFPRFGGNNTDSRFQSLAFGLTSTISPTLVNEARFSYGRTYNLIAGQNQGIPVCADAGMPFAFTDEFNAGMCESIGFSSTSITRMAERQPWLLEVDQFQWYDGVTWIKGAHTVKFGLDIKQLYPFAALGTHANNIHAFSGQFSGDGFADFLYGTPSSDLLMLKENDPADFSRFMIGGYFQDDWKVSPTLTINIGVRYEFNQIPREAKGLTPSFQQDLISGPNQLPGGLVFPSQNNEAVPWFEANRPDIPVGLLDRETLFRPDKNNIAPRLGIAWRPFGHNRTVIRTGYGFYYSSAQLANLVQNSVTGPPAQIWPTNVSDPDTPTLDYGGPIGSPPEDALKVATFGVITGPENQWLEAYTQQWSFSVGQTLGTDLVLQAQYLGSKSTHVENLIDYNHVAPGPGRLQERLPFPNWGRLAGFSSGAGASYHALLLTAEKRYSHGLTFKGAYTYSKTLTRGGGRLTGGNIALVQDPTNLKNEHAYSIDDMRHRFVTSFIYELPVGRDKPWGGGMSGAANAVLGGWEISAVMIHSTGLVSGLQPTLSNGANCNTSFFNRCRPDRLRDHELGGNGVDSPKYDSGAFTWRQIDGGPFRYGTSQANILRGNGINNWDLALRKSVRFGESMRVEFRWESFNALNHPSFANPSAGVTSPNFGRTFSTQLLPRVNQFGLKFYW